MRIIITGSTGFVGAAMVRYFHAQGHEIIACGRQQTPPEKLTDYARYVAQDISKPMREMEADACIHVAALASDTAGYKELHRNNVTGTANVMKATAGCKHFVYISSSSVYLPNPFPIKETDALYDAKQLSPYGKSKLQAEREIMELKRPGQQVSILRPRAIYGVGDRVLLPRIVGLVKMNRLILLGNMQVQSSLTHINNLIMGVEQCLTASPVPGQIQIFNISDAEPYLLQDIIKQLIHKLYKKNIPSLRLPLGIVMPFSAISTLVNKNGKLSKFVLNAVKQSAVLDINKIKNELMFVPRESFHTTADEIVKWVHDLGGIKEYMKKLNAVPWL